MGNPPFGGNWTEREIQKQERDISRSGGKTKTDGDSSDRAVWSENKSGKKKKVTRNGGKEKMQSQGKMRANGANLMQLVEDPSPTRAYSGRKKRCSGNTKAAPEREGSLEGGEFGWFVVL